MPVVDLTYKVEFRNVFLQYLYRYDGVLLDCGGMSSRDVIDRLKTGEYEVAFEQAREDSEYKNYMCTKYEISKSKDPDWVKMLLEDMNYVIKDKKLLKKYGLIKDYEG